MTLASQTESKKKYEHQYMYIVLEFESVDPNSLESLLDPKLASSDAFPNLVHT